MIERLFECRSRIEWWICEGIRHFDSKECCLDRGFRFQNVIFHAGINNFINTNPNLQTNMIGRILKPQVQPGCHELKDDRVAETVRHFENVCQHKPNP